ncbi:MAG TPA: hypothetical protein VK975_05075 [Acidimicrobiales bacterium]|nr:hypothetical protein [Acidimicrobiales bacterium]
MARREAARTLGVVVVVALALVGCSPDAGPPPQSAADAPVRSTTTTAPPPPVLERLAIDPAVFGGGGDQRLVAVAAGVAPAAGARLVAVGSAGGRPAVWWSADGRSWQRASFPPEASGEGMRLDDVVADPVSGSWSVVGADGEGAAAWLSRDGERWVRAEVDDGPPMTTVAPTSLGLVALGAGVGGAAAWQSFSGERWVRAVDDPSVFARPGPQRVVDVVDDGSELKALVEREDAGTEVWRSDDGLVWSVAPSPGKSVLPGGGASRASAASALGATMVVVGSDAKDDGIDASMWLSSLSAPFDQVVHDEDVLGGDGDQSMTALAQHGDRLLVVGTETDDGGDLDAVVWASAPAGGLQRTFDEGPATPGDQHVTGVARLGEVAVAVGWEETPTGVDAVAWTVSSIAPAEPEPRVEVGPALGWMRVTGQDALGGPGEQRLEAVVPAGGEGWLAVGSMAGEGGEADGAVWRSPDGLEWATVPATGLAGPGEQRLLDVAAGPAGIVAVGHEGESAAVWTSTDGGGWERVPHDEGIFGGQGAQQVQAVAAEPGEGGGWVAVGSDTGAAEGDAVVWRSPDGTSWERVVDDTGLGGPGAQAAFDVLAGLGRLTAVGVTDGSATAWGSADGGPWLPVPLPGSATANGVTSDEVGALLVVGSAVSADLDAGVWRSAGGGSWERQEGDELVGPLDQEATAVARGEELAVAVGRSNLGGGDDAAVWSSADGLTWVRSTHDEELFGGDQAQRMLDVAVQGTTAVAVGWSGSSPETRDAAVWLSDLRGGGSRANL